MVGIGESSLVSSVEVCARAANLEEEQNTGELEEKCARIDRFRATKRQAQVELVSPSLSWSWKCKYKSWPVSASSAEDDRLFAARYLLLAAIFFFFTSPSSLSLPHCCFSFYLELFEPSESKVGQSREARRNSFWLRFINKKHFCGCNFVCGEEQFIKNLSFSTSLSLWVQTSPTDWVELLAIQDKLLAYSLCFSTFIDQLECVWKEYLRKIKLLHLPSLC